MKIVIYLYYDMSIMSDLFIKKQVYECSKCGALLNSKADFEEHYEKKHNLDKYLGVYIISKDGKYVGKIDQKLSLIDSTPLLVHAVKISLSRNEMGIGFLPQILVPNVVYRRYAMSPAEVDARFTIVPLEVAKEHLESQFKQIGYELLKDKAPIYLVEDFLNSSIREKGDEDGD